MIPLQIYFPEICQSEIKWILSVIFEEWLGLNYELKINPCSQNLIVIRYKDKEIECSCDFFELAHLHWLKEPSMPKLPFKNISSEMSSLLNSDVDLPVLFGSPKLQITENKIGIEFDIFGTCFFFLSRYEEQVISERDKHQRFPAHASILYQAGILNRPLVDQYVAFLWQLIKYQWPEINKKTQSFKTIVSCDVDQPYEEYTKSWFRGFKHVTKEALFKRRFRSASHKLSNLIATKFGYFALDPNHQFEWMMQANEDIGNQMIFYFIVDHGTHLDGNYQIDEPRIRQLIRQIHSRGHQIGLHGSYYSYNNLDQLLKEKNKLIEILESENISIDTWHCRQHYLRWESSLSAENLDHAGFNIDSTLGFAEFPGFRCGTSQAYSMYSLNHRMPLKLKQQPLILMECSVLSDAYLNMDYSDQTLEYMISYKNSCQNYHGQFTLLWHNSYFKHVSDRPLYKKLL